MRLIVPLGLQRARVIVVIWVIRLIRIILVIELMSCYYDHEAY